MCVYMYVCMYVCIYIYIYIYIYVYINIHKMTLEHKYSQKGPFKKKKEIYTLSESWIKKLSIDVWFVRIGQYLAKIQLKF